MIYKQLETAALLLNFEIWNMSRKNKINWVCSIYNKKETTFSTSEENKNEQESKKEVILDLDDIT